VPLDLQTRIDAAVEQNLAPDEYFSLWEEFGVWQLDALKAVGMQPRHTLLDVGCGAMRLGVYAVDYLDDGHYFGIDAFPPYISAAKRLAAAAGLTKKFSLLVAKDFEFDRFGMQFDYAIAQSVLTHLSGEECHRCMAALRKVMKPGGIFLVTYLVGRPATQGLLYGAMQPMRRFAESNPEFFADLGKAHGTSFERLEMPHPSGQEVGIYRYPG
jgi:cyclopropane fatty-acyl-phospholipid synthase-like methyltransferase